jgi:hypothetical protein
MIPFTDMTGLASSAVAIAATAFMLSGVARIPVHYRMALAGFVAIAALIPFGGLAPAAYVRGVIGDVSITSLVLLLMTALRQLNGSKFIPTSRVSDAGRSAGLSFIAFVSLGFYPLALGIGSFDPYRWGFGSPWLLGALLAAALFAFHRQQRLAALVIALAVLGWAVGWYESNNLWDYLLDPLLAIYATGALAKCGVRSLPGCK